MFPANLQITAPSLAIYLHVPFCTRKCGYCDFFSIPGASVGQIERTLEASIADLETALYSAEAVSRIRTLYIGGGTPSIIGPETLSRFIESILSLLPDHPDEITIEMNPESVEDEHISVCNDLGIDRLSIGIQSFDQEILTYLDRNATPSTNRYTLRRIVDNFRGEINIDLICGIPGQTPELLRSDIDQATSFSPGHISLYTLTIEPETRLALDIARGVKPDVDEDLQSDLWRYGIERLEERGYSWYEISNFALPGKESRHNLGYWGMEPYLGIGPGAVSTIPGATGPLRLTADHRIPEPSYRVEPILPDELLLEHFLMGLRTSRGVDRPRLREIFGIDPFAEIDEVRAAPIVPFLNQGLLRIADDRIVVPDKGRMILDTILTAVALSLDSHVVATCDWPVPDSEST